MGSLLPVLFVEAYTGMLFRVAYFSQTAIL